MLALDPSYHLGYAVLEYDSNKLVEYGTEHLPDGDYGEMPWDAVDKADHMALSVLNLVKKWQPYAVCIEQTNKGRNRWSQKGLEFLHYAMLKALRPTGLPIYYIDTSAWRKTLDMSLSKIQKLHNAKIGKLKKEAKGDRKKFAKLKKDAGVKGKIGKKHVSLFKAVELFEIDFKMKQENELEAALQGYAFLKGCPLSDPRK